MYKFFVKSAQRWTAMGFTLALLVIFSGTLSAAGTVEVLWLGHSATRITSVNGKVIVIDPFLKKNSMAPAKYRDLSAFGKVDLILVTHGHGDHTMDLPELARKTDAMVIANFEYVRNLVALKILKADRIIQMNKGGTVEPLGRGIKVHMVPAEHSSGVYPQFLGMTGPLAEATDNISGGEAVGYVIEFENGFKLYHSGDTAVFGDMALIREFFQPDLAMLPIGGNFTMDPEAAAYAARELIKPKMVIPIHYGTFPAINRTPAEFKKALGNAPIKMLEVVPGQALNF